MIFTLRDYVISIGYRSEIHGKHFKKWEVLAFTLNLTLSITHRLCDIVRCRLQVGTHELKNIESLLSMTKTV